MIFRALIVLMLLLAPAVYVPAATSGENPYAPIPARNMFGLVPIPTNPPVDPAAANPPPKITPNGIMNIFGKLQVLFKVQAPPVGGQPAKELSYTMSEGERQDEIEVQKIDEKAATIVFNNHGTPQTLELVKSSGAAAAPAPAAGQPHAASAVPMAVAHAAGGAAPAPAIGFGGRFGRTRPQPGANAPSSPGGSGGWGGANVAGNSPNNLNSDSETISPEAQVILIEAQRQQMNSSGNPMSALLPPTPITKQLNEEAAQSPGGPE